MGKKKELKKDELNDVTGGIITSKATNPISGTCITPPVVDTAGIGGRDPYDAIYGAGEEESTDK